jgi:RNA polymerase sigma-70 factor, ECF subfamily
MANVSASRSEATLRSAAIQRSAAVSDQAADQSRATAEQGATDMPAIVAAHHVAVYRYARRLVGCSCEAEDLTQQTFLIAQEKLDQLRDATRTAAWLLAIARNCFLKSRRRQQPATAEALGLEIDHVPDCPPASDDIDREALASALAQLPDDFRVVLLMFYFEELSYQEIAAQLDLPLGTVMSRLSRAKGHLRAKLAPPAAEPAKPLARRPLNGATKSVPVRTAR